MSDQELDAKRLRRAWTNHIENDHADELYDAPTIVCARRVAAEYARLSPSKKVGRAEAEDPR